MQKDMEIKLAAVVAISMQVVSANWPQKNTNNNVGKDLKEEKDKNDFGD